MAFQIGTRVDPRLGALDFSGFTNAANIRAQALANLGQTIGEGFEKYQRNKQITADNLATLETISVTRPEVYGQLRNSDTEIGKKIKNIEDGNYKNKDVQQVIGAVQTAITSLDAQQASNLRALELSERTQEQTENEASRKAFNQAIKDSTNEETGEIDADALSRIYLSEGGRDPDDLTIIDAIKDLDGPNIKVEEIGGFTVLTQNGKYMTASRNGKPPTSKALETLEGELKQLQRARELYNQGNEEAANDILAILGLYKDAFGNPKPASEVFGTTAPNPPPLSDEELRRLQQLREKAGL
jgi:hypothetical protein